MKSKLFIAASAISIMSVSALAQNVPNIFTPNTPANAAEVNENFAFLAKNSIGTTLVDGEIELVIDCTADAAALNKAYAEHVNYKDLNFSIKGDCYGDITVKRTLDVNNVWEGSSYQVAGQTISIYPQEGQVAGLIPNDLSDKVAIWGGFGGGLYLNDLTVTLSTSQWDYGAAFSRNGQGAVRNVTIVGPATPNGAGIWVQEGAQVYIRDVSISNVVYGIYGNNNATIRFLPGPTIIASQNQGIRVLGSSIRQQADLTVTSAEGTALYLDGGSHWLGSGSTITATGTNIMIAGGSTLAVDTLAVTGVVDVENSSLLKATNFTSGHLQVTSSELVLGTATTENTTLNMSKLTAQSLTAVGVDLMNSSAYIYAGTITAQTNLTQQSFMRTSNTTFADVKIERTSTFNGADLTITNLTAQDNSVLDLITATISTEIGLDSNSTGILENVTFNGATFNVNQANARIMGTTKMPTSKLACWGLSQVEYEGVADILTEVPSSNCLDQSSITTLMGLVKSNHLTPQ